MELLEEPPASIDGGVGVGTGTCLGVGVGTGTCLGVGVGVGVGVDTDTCAGASVGLDGAMTPSTSSRSASAVPSAFALVPGMLVSNVWLYRPEGGPPWLIDCAHRAERRALLSGLKRLGVSPDTLAGVVLTHRHSDHAGNARFLQQRFGTPFYAHREDAEVLEARAERPRLARGDGSRLAGVLAGIENRWPAATLRIERGLEDGDEIEGLEVHWIPGHTRGSIFLRHDGSGALLTGDTILTAEPPLVRRPGLFLAYGSFSEDLQKAWRGVAEFHAQGTPYRALLPGHGVPRADGIRHEVVRRLDELGIA